MGVEGDGEGGPRGKGERDWLCETDWSSLALAGLSGTAGEWALLGLTAWLDEWRYVTM